MREKEISKNGATSARGGSGMIEGWLAILRIFPPPMAAALPLFVVCSLPFLPSFNLPSNSTPSLPKASPGRPSCHRVDVNSRVQILARSKFRTGN